MSKRLAEIKASMCVRRIRQEMEVAFHLLQSNFNLNLSLSSRLSNCLATKQEACTVLVSASGRRHSAISVCLLKAMFLLRRTLNVYCFLLSSEAHYNKFSHTKNKIKPQKTVVLLIVLAVLLKSLYTAF